MSCARHRVPRPGHVRCAYLETVEQEADLVAGWLAERRGDGTGAAPVPTQAVLCRRRSQMSRFEDALHARGVPVVVLGLGGLLDEPEVVDLVSVLTAAADPGRGDAVVRLLTGPRWHVGPADLDALADRARELAGEDRDATSLVDALDLLPGPGWVSRRGRRLSEPGRAACASLSAVLHRVRQSLHRPVVDVVLAAVQATAVDVEVLAASGDLRHGRRVLDRFLSEAAGYVDVDGSSTLAGFLTWLDAAREDERGLEVVDVAPDPGAVQIITIHSAKGLEWDDVAVVDLVAGGFPVREASGKPAAGWLSGNGELPWPARGDVDSLPVWRTRAAASREDWKRAPRAVPRRGRPARRGRGASAGLRRADPPEAFAAGHRRPLGHRQQAAGPVAVPVPGPRGRCRRGGLARAGPRCGRGEPAGGAGARAALAVGGEPRPGSRSGPCRPRGAADEP